MRSQREERQAIARINEIRKDIQKINAEIVERTAYEIERSKIMLPIVHTAIGIGIGFLLLIFILKSSDLSTAITIGLPLCLIFGVLGLAFACFVTIHKQSSLSKRLRKSVETEYSSRSAGLDELMEKQRARRLEAKNKMFEIVERLLPDRADSD